MSEDFQDQGPCCSPKPRIQDRPLIDDDQASGLEALFKVLSNATRLRMLHMLVREPDMSVGAIANTLGMKTQAVSNQLQRLLDRGIVTCRRNGNLVCYRVVDPCVLSLLEQGCCLMEELPPAK